MEKDGEVGMTNNEAVARLHAAADIAIATGCELAKLPATDVLEIADLLKEQKLKKKDIVTGLRLCKPAWFTVENCERGEQCPYHKYGHDIGGCVDHLIDDALVLLQETEKDLEV